MLLGFCWSPCPACPPHHLLLENHPYLSHTLLTPLWSSFQSPHLCPFLRGVPKALPAPSCDSMAQTVCLSSSLKMAAHSLWLFPSRGGALGFPGGAVVGSLPANAGDTGSSPGLGRSHMPRSGWAREPQLLSLRIWSLCPATGGAAIEKGPRTAMKSGPHTAMRSGPRLPQLEKAHVQQQRPNTAKKIN